MISASSIVVDDTIIDGLIDGWTTVGFVYGGTTNDGILLYGMSDDVTTIVSDGVASVSCHQQIRGLYYANVRGMRLQPLDPLTLAVLQTRDSSYS